MLKLRNVSRTYADHDFWKIYSFNSIIRIIYKKMFVFRSLDCDELIHILFIVERIHWSD